MKKKINLFKDFQAGRVPGKAGGHCREKGVFTPSKAPLGQKSMYL